MWFVSPTMGGMYHPVGATLLPNTHISNNVSDHAQWVGASLPQNTHISNTVSDHAQRVYHSSFVDEEGITKACGFPLLPLKSHIKGPAPISDQDKIDIVDEAISFFRANVFFRNFDVKSSADKLLIYLTFYINVALKRLEGCRTLAVGTKAIITLGLENVPVPGETGFPFPGLFSLPQSGEEAELLRNYMKQIREETSGRLLNCAYRPNGTPNKWWLAFAKRKFMNTIVPDAETSQARKPGYQGIL